MARRKRRPGTFRPGYDPRRHVLTSEERRRGYQTTLARYGGVDDPGSRWLLWRAKRAGHAAPAEQMDAALWERLRAPS